ncbi:porin family protein [Shewanella halifaxensis]|uniref:porin family protein n=1 Tax=Shewanella halifaxensis TaxID=271098 RepID=UPI000D58DBDC|nr:porin family protein [Shewanella halifaxensis]
MKKIVLSTLMLTLLSTNSLADNIIGGAIGYGAQEFELNNITNEGDEFNFDLYYRYMINKNIGVEAGWQSATGGIGSFIIDQISEVKDAHYSGPRIASYFQYPIFNETYAYAKLGVNKYKLDYLLNDISSNESDLGFEGSIGFEKRFKPGIGLNLEYRLINSSIIKANQFLIGFSYKF